MIIDLFLVFIEGLRASCERVGFLAMSERGDGRLHHRGGLSA